MNDRELIAAFCGGSEEAFAELVSRHGALVWSAARRRLAGNEALADDVVQKTFVLLARKACSLKRGVSVSGWLYTTTVNLAREALRGEQRRRARETEAMRMNPETATPGPRNWTEIAPVLEEAMLELGEADREVILLRYFERTPYNQLAAALGATEAALKMRASRALEKLRAALLRRGVAVSSGALAALLAEAAAVPAPPAILRLATQAAAAAKSPGWAGAAAHWIFMTTAQKTAVAGGVFLLGLLILARFSKEPGPLPASAGAKPELSAASQIPAGSVRTTEPRKPSPDARLQRLQASLRAAIAEEPADRRLPIDRLREAIADFGTERGAAVPVVQEFLNAPRGERRLWSFAAAAYCLQLLGADGSAAIPDVMRLLKQGDLALLNDAIPKLFAALSPDGALLPELISLLQEPPRAAEWVNRSIAELIQKNPAREEQSRQKLAEFLDSEHFGVRFNAALVLARLPGPKTDEALPVLLEGLKPAPRITNIIDLGNGLAMRPDPFAEDLLRLQAAQALGEMGPAGAAAASALLEVAEMTPPDNPVQLREHALAALGKVDPSWRQHSEEIDAELRQQEREKELLKKARTATATFEENLEALRSRSTAAFAAQDLARFPEARSAIPALVESIDRFGNSEAIDLLKEIAPDVLVERVRERKLAGIEDVAQALGELGPAMKDVAPGLRALLDQTRPEDSSRVLAIAEALRRIDPAQPKLVYSFEDLHEAVSAFIGAVNEKNKARSPAYEAYIRDFQDHNAVSRGHLLRFVESTKTDPELHGVFVRKLLEKHPELRAEIQ